jgi:cell growth-regulating nucleolar protein
MIEDSAPPAYAETPMPAIADVMSFQVPDDASFIQNGIAYGNEPVKASKEQYDSFTTPAPKSKKSKRDKDVESTSKKSERKRKRSPAELDMSLVRAQEEKDTMMEDAPPVLHSGLTGGLNRLLARPEFPPSPDDSGDFANSPLSPMKRAKQGTSKALMRAQRDWEIQQQKEKKAEIKEERERQKGDTKEKKDKKDKKEKKEKKEKERGRERDRKEHKASTALVKIRPKKKRDESTQIRRRRQYSSSVSPAPRERKPKAIEYNRSTSGSPAPDGNGQLIVRQEGELALPISTRAELFMSFIKGPDSERGVSVNKALKRYHRELHERQEDDLHKADEEKELWKDIRLKKNDRGEIVLFFASESS